MASLTTDQMKWLDLAKNNPVAFGWETGFKDLTELHNGWMKDMLYGTGDQTILSHRGSYKTTTISLVLALVMILNPNDISMFMRKTDSDVKEIIRQTQILLQSDFFRAFVYTLYGQELKLTTATATEVNTSLQTSTRGAPQLLGIGSKSSLTGKHADRIYTDDIINIEDRISQAERERTKMVYQELQNIKNRGGKIINTGTPWHVDDAFSLMPNIKRYDCYMTGLISHDELALIKSKMSPTLFSANYELKHVSDDKRLFDGIKYASPADMGDFRQSDNTVFAHIDASYAGEDGSALTVAKELPDKTIVVYGALREGHIEQHLRLFEAKIKQMGGEFIMMETNSDKGWLARETRIKPRAYHESTNKEIKISTYLKSRWSDIIFTPDTDPEYINQVLEYTPNATHDDAPDGLATVVRSIEGGSKRRYGVMAKDNHNAMDFFRKIGFGK